MQFPQAGQTFQGKYQLLEVLGRGGFAAVYKAVDTEIGREVAIKLLTPGEDGYDPSTVARFQREARVIAQLKDPHTITMFDYGRTDDDLLFMVFEYVAGKDLSHRLGETGPLPPAIVVHVLDQLLHALREAHEAGVLHRDIKPANVLVFPYLDDDWRVKLLDFGIAKPGVGRNANPVATLTQAGGIIGTPRYMSPEQLCGENLSPSSDIYSLGLLAYEMLVGSPAISGRDTRDNIVLQLSTEPLVLPPQAPVPAQLRRVIERMMAREAGDRFQSAREVIAALRGPDASGPQTGPFGSIPTPNRPGHSPFQGLAGSSSGELRHYTTPRTGPVQAPTKDRSLSPLATLGIGAALGAAIVIPAMMIALQNDNDVAEPPRVNKALTKQVSDHPPVHEPPVVEPSTDSGTAADTVVEEAPSGCGKPAQETGFLARKADFGFGGRGVVTYLPKTYEPNRRYPLVMVFHDRTRDPRQAI